LKKNDKNYFHRLNYKILIQVCVSYDAKRHGQLPKGELAKKHQPEHFGNFMLGLTFWQIDFGS